jgi:carbon monoxide dehydrogenase subunit G
MTTLESNTVSVNKSAREVYNFLSDFRHFGDLMPEQVVDWKATEEECSFSIKGMASLGMKFKQKIPDSLIEAERNGKAPFDFTLRCIIKGQQPCDVKFEFDAELNPMLKMLAEKPLTNFLNLLVTKLQELFAADKTA